MAATIKLGASGPAVKQVQQLLARVGAARLKVSGEFDAATEAAVKTFQKQQKVAASGEVDGSLLKLLMQLQKAAAKNEQQDRKLAKAKLTEKQRQAMEALRGQTTQIKAMRDKLAESRRASSEFERWLQGLEKMLATVGDDAQLANISLQNVLQKQQQTMQMMSNVSKKLHETAMGIIRNIGG